MIVRGEESASHFMANEGGRRCNPFRVEKIRGRLPKVARSRNLGLNDAIPLGFQRVGGFGQARVCAISFPLKIAQPFMAGLARGGVRSPVGDERIPRTDEQFFRPPGGTGMVCLDLTQH